MYWQLRPTFCAAIFTCFFACNLSVPVSWIDHTPSSLDAIRLCKIVDLSSSTQPLVSHAIVVNNDLSCYVYVHGHDVKNCSALEAIPSHLDNLSFTKLICLVENLRVCSGHPEEHFVVKKGKVNYFGKQRARGGRNDNPTVKQCIQNAGALRVQKSHALDPVRGNCRQKRQQEDKVIDIDEPLPKRRLRWLSIIKHKVLFLRYKI